MNKAHKFVSAIIISLLLCSGCTLSTKPFDMETVPRPHSLGVDEESGMDLDHVHMVFKSHQKELGLCYGESVTKGSEQGAKIVLDFDIDVHGHVGRAQVRDSRSALRGQSFHNCVLKELKTWIFQEPPHKKMVHIVYPLFFKNSRSQ